MAFSKKNPLQKAIFPFLAWENRISQRVENRGSLISVPLALRVVLTQVGFLVKLFKTELWWLAL